MNASEVIQRATAEVIGDTLAWVGDEGDVSSLCVFDESLRSDSENSGRFSRVVNLIGGRRHNTDGIPTGGKIGA